MYSTIMQIPGMTYRCCKLQLGKGCSHTTGQGQSTHIAWLHGQTLIEGALTKGLIELHFMDAQVGVSGATPMAAAEDAHGNGEGLVVDQASVDGEDGHQQQDITPCVSIIA